MFIHLYYQCELIKWSGTAYSTCRSTSTTWALIIMRDMVYFYDQHSIDGGDMSE